MPPINEHVKVSLSRTGKEYREVHEWIDAPDKKAERHDITKIHEYAKFFERQYGEEAVGEYIQHIQDDLRVRFSHTQDEIQKAIADTLAYFGVK